MTRASKPCSQPGCPSLQPCPDHPAKRRQPDDRPSAAARGYDRNWRRIRAAYLKKHPCCVECGEPATEVDHRTSLADGGTHEWRNLQSLCKRHHSQKTVKHDGGFGNKRVGGIKSL